MIRLLSLFACFALMLSFVSASVAHAMEPVGCIDANQSAAAGHSEGDADQVPADSDKAYPHHHGGCHGHHVAAALQDAELANAFAGQRIRFGWASPVREATPVHAELRPPIA
ncbi:hypothetical protein J3E64_003705 [Sphingobium sp. OAS761]|uniref:hypothetical protein n=1 Tax=Sphingobium sp. OAS761 TaxID=2817901 RepID=UPI00209FAF5A|nr:hypothetical protein [Sphingobium sp. OAS761]MCP1471990.1 hypothetical protein [Sphingobium sp. OAS761]